MSKTNLPNIDLNLLVILDSIYRERSLTLAGRKLFLTQSAVSHALSRLRDHFEDRLFIRRGNSMEPTPLCRKLHHSISPCIKSILQSLEDRGEFNPATSRRTFCIGMSDYLCRLLLPEILRRSATEAPEISIRIVQPTYEKRGEMLKNGKLDIFLGCSREYGAGVLKERLFKDREVGIVRKDHPVNGEMMTEEELRQCEFAALSLSESGLGFLEDFLYRKGVQRRIKVVVQQETVIPSLVENSDLVGTLAERLARMYTENGKIRIVRLPLQDTSFEIFQHWHSVSNEDPAHKWLRSVIKQTAERIPESAAGAA